MSVRFEVVDPAATRALRHAVLRPDRAAADPLPGDDLADAVHLGAIDDAGVVLCTCFVYADPCPWRPDRAAAWHLRQMATAPDLRGQGLGGGVVEAAADLARERGGRLLWCHAREPAVAFYRRHGFESFGPVFADGPYRIPHRRISRELSSAPASSQL
ncbi:MAG: GNAT family N-acetyltransferase [Jatrophihabitantaceae bacterium]